jgi:glycosyltransferase involved in cell wall biosynthesis
MSPPDTGSICPVATVVVPTRNSARFLDSCLASIRAQAVPIELIVVDNHSTDETVAIARRSADQVVVLGPERSRQRNAGLEMATTDIVAFIDSDMVLEPGIIDEAVHLLNHSRLSAVIIPEEAFGEGFFARCRNLEKRLYQGNPDVEAARVFRTSDVRRLGGYREDLRAGEDWDLADRVARRDNTGRTASVIWHDEGRVELRSAFAKKRYYGRSFATYLATRSDNRRRLIRPSVLCHSGLRSVPALTAGLAILKLVEVCGMALGVVEARLGR